MNPSAVFVLVFDVRGILEEGVSGTVSRLMPWLTTLEHLAIKQRLHTRPLVFATGNYLGAIEHQFRNDPLAMRSFYTQADKAFATLRQNADNRKLFPEIVGPFLVDLKADGECSTEPRRLFDWMSNSASQCACQHGLFAPRSGHLQRSCSRHLKEELATLSERKLRDRQMLDVIELPSVLNAIHEYVAQGRLIITAAEFYSRTEQICNDSASSRRILYTKEEIQARQNSMLHSLWVRCASLCVFTRYRRRMVSCNSAVHRTRPISPLMP